MYEIYMYAEVESEREREKGIEIEQAVLAMCWLCAVHILLVEHSSKNGLLCRMYGRI